MGEPTHQGKTVTEWLDAMVLYDWETNATGLLRRSLTSEQVTNQPGFKALMAIGPKSAPVLLQRVMDLPEPEKPLPMIPRWRRYWSDKMEWVRTGRTVAPRKSTTYPMWQRQRKDAAGLMLVALGTNAGGFSRYLEAYAAAPKPRVSGPLLGVTPGDPARAGAALSAERRAEVVSAITAGLQHTNGEVRRAAANAARFFPEEALLWKPLFLRLTRDSDQYAPHEALFALMRIPPDEEMRRRVEESIHDPAQSERTKEIAHIVIREWDRFKAKADSPK